jgi:ribonuclease HI
MEMMAVLKGLLKLAYPSEVTIVSDSTYVINGMRCWMPSWKRKGWSRGNKDIKNLDIWMQLDVAISGHRVAYKWVKGHAGHEYNERCDKLAMKEVLKHKRR